MKRTLAIILAAVMLLALLAACGGEADPNVGLYKLSGAMGYSLEEFAEMAGMTEEERALYIRQQLDARMPYYQKAQIIFPADQPDLDQLVRIVKG